MKKRSTEEQIIGFMREADAGLPVRELCRKHGFSEPSYYAWNAKFGGMNVSDAQRLKALQAWCSECAGIATHWAYSTCICTPVSLDVRPHNPRPLLPGSFLNTTPIHSHRLTALARRCIVHGYTRPKVATGLQRSRSGSRSPTALLSHCRP